MLLHCKGSVEVCPVRGLGLHCLVLQGRQAASLAGRHSLGAEPLEGFHGLIRPADEDKGQREVLLSL